MSQAECHFIEKFTELFGQISKGNPTYGRLAAHVLLGQILKNTKIYSGHIYVDPRISIFIIQPSATGKSTPWGFISKVATEAGIHVDEVDEATDAALVGSIEQEEIVDPDTGAKIINYKVVKGKLAEAELLHFDEGSMLMERGQHSAHAMTWFQKALNPLGSEQSKCTKKLAHGDQIEFYPVCSLLITSHPLEGVMETILNKGFFQRIIMFPRDIPIPERQAIEYSRADELGTHNPKTEMDIPTLGKLLKDIKEKYDGKEPQFNPNIRPVLKAKIKAFYDIIKDAHPRVKEIMATFIPRYDNYMAVLAYHHMCDRNGDKVEIPDINYAFSVLYLLFKDMMNWVEENADFYRIANKDAVYMRMAQTVYQKMPKDTPEGYVMKMNFVAQCSDTWKLSKITVQKYLDRFRGYGTMKEMELDSVRYVKFGN